MSYPWRAWVKQASNRQLGITEAERIAMERKMEVFCGIGDKKIKDEAGKTANIDTVFDAMPEEQKRDFSKEVINDGLILLGMRKKKVLKEIEDEQMNEERDVEEFNPIRNN